MSVDESSSVAASELLLDGLFDDAALFPPGDAAMLDAVPDHARLRERFGRWVGPFVVPIARLDEVASNAGRDSMDVSVIVPLDRVTDRIDSAHPAIRVTAVEVSGVLDTTHARAAVDALRALPDSVTASVELPRTDARDDVLDVLTGTGPRAKLRTGGMRADLFPSADELAATMAGCVARGLAFKCTAGLHGAAAHVDAKTGFAHHGVLNVLLAVDALLESGSCVDAARTLELTDAHALADEVRQLPLERIARARRSFVSFGTCSVLEPIDELTALGLVRG